MLVVNVLGELCNALCVGLGLELEALSNQKRLKLLVVGNDAVVDDAELPVWVRSTVEKAVRSANRSL
jgi:hypothetical protein